MRDNHSNYIKSRNLAKSRKKIKKVMTRKDRRSFKKGETVFKKGRNWEMF